MFWWDCLATESLFTIIRKKIVIIYKFLQYFKLLKSINMSYWSLFLPESILYLRFSLILFLYWRFPYLVVQINAEDIVVNFQETFREKFLKVIWRSFLYIYITYHEYKVTSLTFYLKREKDWIFSGVIFIIIIEI